MTTKYGIKISKPTFDVKTCTADQLVFSSEFNTLMVAKADAPSTPGNYTHGLGYAPAFIVASADNTEGYFIGQEYSSFEALFGCDSTKFYYYSAPCRYFLFYQPTI